MSGDTARHFLNGLVTCDLNKVSDVQARFGALLTPQGKIVVDFIVAEASAEDGVTPSRPEPNTKRSLRSIALAASPSKGVTWKISCNVRSVELWV